MSLQWTLVAVFLYAEIFFLLLLMLPWIRPNFWAKVFKSRVARAIQSYSHMYTWFGAGILLLLFFDAVRDVRKYSTIDTTVDVHGANHEAVIHMRLFRAQRNLYIAGFALFLWFVIRRVVQLIRGEAQLQASADAALTQARNAAETASRVMAEGGEPEALKAMQTKVDEMNKKLEAARNDRDAMKTQSENLQKEYDRVCDLLSEKGDKKDD